MPTKPACTVVYDGDCPFCSRYARWLRLRGAGVSLELVSARSDHPVVRRLVRGGHDLDQGMALVCGERIHTGADALQRLAVLGSRSGPWDRLNAWVFRSRLRARLLYPVLRAGRNLALRILGRRRIGGHRDAGP